MVSGGKRSPKQQQVITISQQWKININKILTSPKNEREKKASPQQTCTWCTTPEIYMCYFENKLFKLENTKLTHIPNRKSHVPLALSFQTLLWPEHWVEAPKVSVSVWSDESHDTIYWPRLQVWENTNTEDLAEAGNIIYLTLCNLKAAWNTTSTHM